MRRWFCPNLFIATDAQWQTAGHGALFVNPQVLQDLMGITDVFMVPAQPDPGTQPNAYIGYGNLLRTLKAFGIKTALSGGYIYGPGTPYTGSLVASGIVGPELQNRLNAGGTADWVIMDGFPALMLYQCNNTYITPTFNLAQANTELVNFVSYIHTHFPQTQIGLDVNFPGWAYNGVNNYFGAPLTANQPHGAASIGAYNYNYSYQFLAGANDYFTVLNSMVAALSGASLPAFQSFQTDNPYDYNQGFALFGTGSYPTANATIDWCGREVAVLLQAQGLGIPSGPMLHSEGPGNAVGGPDATYYYESLAKQAAIQARGFQSDEIVYISFYSFANPGTLHPANMLPAADKTQPFTESALYRAILYGDPTQRPLWRFFQTGSASWFTSTDDMSARAFYLKNGWDLVTGADTGVGNPIAYEPSGELVYSPTQGTSPLWALVWPTGGSYITGSLTNRNFFISQGWQLTSPPAYASQTPRP